MSAFRIRSYHTTYEDELYNKLSSIEPDDLIDVKMCSASYNYDYTVGVEYGFLVLYKELKKVE